MKVDVVSVLVFLFSAQVEAGVGGLIQVPGRGQGSSIISPKKALSQLPAQSPQ